MPKTDLSNCEREQIHIPAKIQAHGFLLAVSKSKADLKTDLKIEHFSINAPLSLGGANANLIGKDLSEVLPSEGYSEIRGAVEKALSDSKKGAQPPLSLFLGSAPNVQKYDVIIHSGGKIVILEFEKALNVRNSSFSEIYHQVQATLSVIEESTDLRELCDLTAEEVKKLTGYDRIMIYQFDSEWNGKGIAEAKAQHREPFLGLHYPASDIPAQARALYLRNWLRIIPDVYYQAIDVVPALHSETKQPLDLSDSVLRSVSPMHVQYLKNMGVGASMSVSIIHDKKLWGLIACHHSEAKYLSYETRQGLEFIGKYFSSQIGAKVKRHNSVYRRKLKSIQPMLFALMKQESTFLDGLFTHNPNLLDLVSGAVGAATYYRGQVIKVGEIPNSEEIQKLSNWLRDAVGNQPVFHTTCLAQLYPDAENFKDIASGLMCISIPEPDPFYIMIFKPEVIQTVNWGGNPNKPVEVSETGSVLSPRRSFALWKETVRHTSLPWAIEEMEALEELRHLIIEADLGKQVKDAISSNDELDQFAYVISHDLKEPLRGISAFAEFIKEDTKNALDPESVENLAEISRLSEKGRRLITELYEYSRLGKVELSFAEVDLDQIVRDVIDRLKLPGQRTLAIKIDGTLPKVYCDRIRIGELYFNLISNAVKYNRSSEQLVELGVDTSAKPMVFYVRDNGIGIAEKDYGRVFRMFERLNDPDQYPGGTGSGLAIVKKIVERHSGKIWICSQKGEGTTFKFTLSPD